MEEAKNVDFGDLEIFVKFFHVPRVYRKCYQTIERSKVNQVIGDRKDLQPTMFGFNEIPGNSQYYQINSNFEDEQLQGVKNLQRN